MTTLTKLRQILEDRKSIFDTAFRYSMQFAEIMGRDTNTQFVYALQQTAKMRNDPHNKKLCKEFTKQILKKEIR